MNKVTNEQLDSLIKSAVNSSGPLPHDEKFSQIISALRELRTHRNLINERGYFSTPINNHPAHGPVSLDRLHQIREILSKASAQSDGGNLGYAMADAVKVIDGVIAAFDAEPVGEVVLGEYDDCGSYPDARVVCIAADGQADWENFKDGTRLYAVNPAQVSIDERAAFNAWNNDENLPIAGVGAKNAAWLAWQARATMLQSFGNSEQLKPLSHGVKLPLAYLQGHKDGLDWAAQLAEANHPQTGDWLYDDPTELARAIRKGPDMPPVQTASVVDADDNFYSWFGREWDKYYQPNNYSLSAKKHLGAIAESAWFACRAAMLQAGNSPSKCSLREGIEAIRNSGIPVDVDKIQSECEDGNHTEKHLDMVDHFVDANEKGKDGTLINEGTMPATQIKPVADLYGITSPTGSETTFTFDASEASSFAKSGWTVQEYVELERYQQSVTGNSPEVPDCWIPVSERMPDKLIPVMVMYADGEMWSAMWSGQFWDDGCTIPDPHAITHWREMPAAPQQEVEGE